MLPDSVFDAALDYIAQATRLTICSSEPANYAAIAGVSLGDVTLTAGDGNGDWTIADGDISGRKLTMEAQTVTPTGDGTVTYLAYDEGSELLGTVPITSQDVANGVDEDIPATKVVELKDPTYS